MSDEELAEAWDNLREADDFEAQRNAVMDLSDMIFGDQCWQCWQCWRRGADLGGCNCVGPGNINGARTFEIATVTDTSSQASLTVNGVTLCGPMSYATKRALIQAYIDMGIAGITDDHG